MLWVELLPDPATDAWVRAAWARLEQADLPNLSRHRSDTNRPHLTISGHRLGLTDPSAEVGPESDPTGSPITSAAEVRTRLASVVARLPVTVRPGPLAVFETGGRRTRFVLVRTLAVSDDLLALHRVSLEAMGTGDQDHPHHTPGAWVPHLSLAARLTAEQMGAALEVLAAEVEPAPVVRLVEARVWDAERRRVLTIDTGDRGRTDPP